MCALCGGFCNSQSFNLHALAAALILSFLRWSRSRYTHLPSGRSPLPPQRFIVHCLHRYVASLSLACSNFAAMQRELSPHFRAHPASLIRYQLTMYDLCCAVLPLCCRKVIFNFLLAQYELQPPVGIYYLCTVVPYMLCIYVYIVCTYKLRKC